MKKNILLILFVTVAGASVLLTGCSKDNTTTTDTTSPVITLTGSASIDIPLNSSAWTDLLGTATDNVDGYGLLVTSNASSSNPNVNRSGTYIITYTATDKAGNVGQATRSIRVYNEAEIFAGNYNNSVDTCVSTPPSGFNATVTLSDSINRLVKVKNFGAFGAAVYVWVTITGNTNGSAITLSNGQSLGGNAQISSVYPLVTKVISGNSTSTSFFIKYGWTDGSSSDVCETTYTR